MDIKRFAIITAAFSLGLHTEIALAASCPNVISGSSLATQTCEFDTGSSINVTNGGELGAIAMGGYSASQILISDGGFIGDSASPGINLTASTLTNGITNNGTISTDSVGLSIGLGSTVDGITNNGSITAGEDSNAIDIGSGPGTTTINNGITNNGTIDSSGNGDDLAINNGAIIYGNITNNGSISGGINASGISLNDGSVLNGNLINNNSISDAAYGLKIDSSTINGDISNTSMINTGSYGLFITGSSVGSISNTGTIESTNAAAITISNGSTVNGDFFNSGTITGANNDSGITLGTGSGSTTITGNFINTGTITAGPAGGNALLFVANTHLNGSIENSGTIDGSNWGLGVLNVSTVGRDILNSGSILGTLDGLHIGQGSEVNGEISNTNLIQGGNYGLAVSASYVDNGIINSGSLRGGSAGLQIDDASVVTGDVSNSGTIQGDTNGLEITLGSTINGSISNSGTIQGSTDAIYISADSSVTNGINIIGTHARLIGNVDAIPVDFNITSGADFSSEGTFNVNTFNIASDAIFNMNNNITAATGVNNSGTLNVANAIRTITGDYTQNTGGIFQLGITNGSDYGQLAASGAVDLSLSGNVDVQVASNSSIHSGEVFSNVISSSALTSPTDGFNVTDNSFLWNFSAATNFTNDGVNLTATLNSQAYNACLGDYCQGAANTIINQVAAGNSAFGDYATLATADAFKNAASQATPELTNENVQALQFETRSVMDVVPMWSNLHGESAGDAMIYEPGKWWLKPYGGSMSQDSDNTVPGFNADVYGSVLGRDTQLSDNSLFGGAIAFGRNNLTGKSELNTQSINSDDYQGMLYGTRLLPHNLYIAGQGLLGYENNQTSRGIPLYTDTASGSYGSWFTNLRSQLGWNAYVTQNLVITPNLDASYLFVNQNAYQESGSAMDLNVNSSNNSSLVLGAYTNAAYHLATSNNKQEVTLTGYAGIAGDVLNSTPTVSSTFVAGGPSFSTFGAQFNSVVFRGGVGLNFQHPRQPVSLSLNYDLQAGNNAYSGVGSATISYKL